ncbi:MAG: Ca-activated chloride channel family protein [Kiritimatiellia bacterium]|jgi:Ca-activated chloride channel family protein
MKRLAFFVMLAAPCLALAGTDDFYPSMLVSNGQDLVLEHTSVEAEVQVGLAVVSVRQTFSNPYHQPIDATYVFPLPNEAAVRSMQIACGGRTIVGEIMTSDHARDVFDTARHAGRRAALLEQQRSNVFTQEVASICPGQNVVVSLEYVEQLTYDRGRYELVFPTTIGPRFNPGNLNEPPLVLPTRGSRTIDIEVDIAEGVAVQSLWSDSHDITIVDEGAWGAQIELTGADQIPNKDFTLGWTLAGERPRGSVITSQTTEENGYIAVTVEPQILVDLAQQRKRELLFVLDASCSMRGRPWQSAVDTVDLAMTKMGPKDTFNLVKFSNAAGSLFETPQPATAQNIALAHTWLQHSPSGGSHMRAGIIHSLDMPGDAEAMRLVLFLTDGYIGDEAGVFDAVERHLGDARLFSLGIGSSVNRTLLEGLAETGRGTVKYQLAGTPISETVSDFYARIAHPAMSDISVDFGDLEITEQYPSRIPDLWAGQPLRVVAKYRGAGNTDVRVRGIVDGELYTISVPIDVDGGATHEAVPTLWARRKIHDLTYDYEVEHDERSRQITEIALEHHLVSQMTSLVAVEETASTCAASKGVNIPSYQPAGVTGVGAWASIQPVPRSYLRGSGAAGVQGQPLGSPIILGSVDKSYVEQIVQRHMKAIRYCYQRQLQMNPGLTGKIVIKFVVNRAGSVTQAEVKSSTIHNKAVEDCLVARFESMKFPGGTGEMVVSYPFIFRPK